MKLFILGQSQSGKTTLAQHIAQTYGFQYISASDWVKQIWQQSVEDFPSRERYISAITDYSREYLRKYANACVDDVRDRLDPNQPAVIDGIRNPRDFVSLFDWKGDRTLHLSYASNPIPTNSFEQGLTVIQAYLNWLLDNGFIQSHQCLTFGFQTFHTDDPRHSFDHVLQQLPELLNPEERCDDSLRSA